MNPKRLLQHFNEITEAPDAVPRLRRFILDLAVRGKLVEQDPNDEPVSELLKKIEAEKERLAKAGELRNHQKQPLGEEQIAFTIPGAWSWTHLAQIGIINPQNDNEDNAEASFIPMRMIYAEYRQPSQHEIRPWGEIRKGFTHFADGDVGLAKITPCFENGKSTVFRNLTGGIGAGTTELHIVRPIFIVADYILIFLKSSHFIEAGISKMTGTAGQKRVPKDYFALSPFPLPPLAEQHRIVAKVDQLMALCDELEAAQQKRERRRDRLVAATLNGLGMVVGRDGKGRDGSPSRPDDSKRPQSEGRDRSPNGPQLINNGGFGETALPKFFLTHLPRLTTRPEHIQQLRQTILNLAVRGKLVPQDPNDEPASELLKHIQAEKTRLEKDGRIKREKLIEAGADPFAIPENWKWARLGELTELITKGSSPKWQGVAYVSKDEGVLFVTSENVGNYRLRKLDELKYVEKRFNEIEPRSILRFGDILMNLVGASIGRTALYDLHNVANINQAVALIRLIQSAPNMCAEFLLHYLNSPSAIQLMMASQVVTAQPNISLTNAREFPIPVPPLAEQHGIVAKVKELMDLCDRLQAQLSTTQIESHRLLQVVLNQTLAQVATG